MTTNIQGDIVLDATESKPNDQSGKVAGFMSKINNVRSENPKLFYGVIVVLVVLLVFWYLKKNDKLPGSGKKKEGAASAKKKTKVDKKLEALEDDVDEKTQIDELIDSIEKKQKKNTGTVARPE